MSVHRILVVDDKEENLYLLTSLLTGHGYLVDTAHHGAEALAKARAEPPDLVVSDLLMPVMDGYTLLRRWKDDPRLQAIPFVVYTATYTDAADERLALDQGADAFILKPAEPAQFVIRVRDVLARDDRGALHPAHAPLAERPVVMREYSEVLVRKLEEKAVQLEEANRTLAEDIAAREQAERLLRGQSKLLEQIASGAGLRDVLTSIVLCIESNAPDTLASLLLVDADGLHLRHGAAPSLPTAFWEAIDGEPIGPEAGSCGTAAFRNEPVTVVDIPTDPLWARYASLALEHGLRACWATPIVDAQHRVLGTFAMYAREGRGPSASDQKCVDIATSVASIAITRHRSEEAHRRSERRYQRLMDANLIGVMIARTDGSVAEANDRFLEMIGASRDELTAGTVRWDSITPPEWRHVDDEIIRRLQSSGISPPIEKEYFHRDGHRVPILASVALVDDLAGDCLCLVEDLTALKAAEAERAQVLERISDSVVALDTSWNYTYLNARAAASFGHTPESLVGKHIWSVFPEGVNQPFHLAYERAVRDQQPIQIEEYYEPYDKWFENRIYPSATGLTIFFGDITESKRAEAALRESEARYRLLVEEGGDVFLIAGADRRIAYVSPSVRRMLGRDPAALVGLTPADIVHPDDVPLLSAANARRAAEPGTGERVRMRVRHADGSWRNVEAFGVNLSGITGKPQIMAVWHDITDQLRFEQTLRESADQMRRLSRHVQEAREDEQTRLSREIHDRLGQSLTMLKLGLAHLVSKMPAANTRLNAQGRQVLADVDATIAATREIAMHVRPPLLDDLGIGAALEWSCQRFTERTAVPVTLDLPMEHVPREAGRALYAVVQEALTNIIRHAAATHVWVSLRPGGRGVQLTVRDDGTGFDPSGDAAGRLGLLGMRERALAVGGSVAVQSKVGAGTTIVVDLPLTTDTVPAP